MAKIRKVNLIEFNNSVINVIVSPNNTIINNSTNNSQIVNPPNNPTIVNPKVEP